MSNNSREEWIAICREFLKDSAAAFSEGGDKQWIEINGRRIEVAFIDHDGGEIRDKAAFTIE